MAEARVGYREYSGDPIALCRVRAHWGGVALGEVSHWGRCCIRGGVALGEMSQWGVVAWGVSLGGGGGRSNIWFPART